MQYRKKRQRQKTPGYLNAIIVVKAFPGNPYSQQPDKDGYVFLKYHNIKPDKDKFLLFAAKFPGAEYVNFYDCITKAFKERIYLQ